MPAPCSFPVILNYLRTRQVNLGHLTPEEVTTQAQYFGLKKIVDHLMQIALNVKRKKEVKDDLEFFGREKLIREVLDITQKVEECGEVLCGQIDSTKDELAFIGSNIEELWRIKCEIKEIAAARESGS